MKCAELTGFVETCLDAYVDGELDERECGELEAHLSECDQCREAVRGQARLKAFIRERAGAIRAPESFAGRLAACLDETDLEDLSDLDDSPEDEEARPNEAGHPIPHPALLPALPRPPVPTWRSMPVFASVAFLLVFVWMASGGFVHDPLVDDAVRKHARGLPLEVTGPAESLQRWLQDKVDFLPAVLEFPSGLEPLGARISHVRDRPAIYVGYGRPGSGPDGERRASLFAFCDPTFDPTAERHRSRQLGTRNVVVTNRNGFNVVLWSENQVVYSLVSDLEEREILALIEAASR